MSRSARAKEAAPAARIAGVLTRAVVGFRNHDNRTRAAALAFDTTFAIVPALVVFVAVLKAVAAYSMVRRELVSPWLAEAFPPATDASLGSLGRAFEEILILVERVDLRALGIVGTGAVVYTSISLLVRVERGLDVVFGTNRRRRLVARAGRYIVALGVGPLATIPAAALGFAVMGKAGAFMAPAMVLASFLLVTVGLFAMYRLVPSAQVNARDATAGATVGAIGLVVVFAAFVRTQVGLSGLSVLYAGLSAVPVFMLWVYLSWYAVLFGAEVAAARGARTPDSPVRDGVAGGS